jgi:RNA polymerase primary sigma factor
MKDIKDIIEAKRVQEAYNKLKEKLTTREKDVLVRYYGIGKQVRHSLYDIGARYNVTRERIRQIKAEALRKLKIKK